MTNGLNTTYFFYDYDAAGRLVRSYSGTSSNGSNKVKDVEYTYLANGKVKRMQLGNAQGVDYLYSERDWLKQINHQSLTSAQDPGHDGGGNGIPVDKFGMVIGYNNISDIGSVQGAAPQYNGNISWLMYNMAGVNYTYPDPTLDPTSLVGYTYTYDKANRLKAANFGFYTRSSAAGWNWWVTNAYDETNYTYDMNGNIVTVSRNSSTGSAMDNLTYYYQPTTSNRLNYISDAVVGNSSTTDIKNQAANNYVYDANGNMIKDVQNSIDPITYDYRNLPLQIKKNGVITTYRYDASGNRVYKSTAGGATYYYLNDPSGKTVAVISSDGSLKMLNAYGLENIGYVKVSLQTTYIPPPPDCGGGGGIESVTQAGGDDGVTTNTPAPVPCEGTYVTTRTDSRYYYLKDHLGTIKMTVDASGNVTSYDDYYPFGMTMEGRSMATGGDARYKFTSKERDVETGYDYFGARYYDARIGRWLSVDPLAGKYPDLSPYNYASNNPVKYFDSDGRDAKVAFNGNGVTIQATLYIYGSGASASIAQSMQSNIMRDWNNNGAGWQYNDQGTGEIFNVKFDVSVNLYDPKDPTNVPFIIIDSWNPFSTNNYVEVGATPSEVSQSHVDGGDEGVWRGYGPDPSSHEFGHLVGLDDQYTAKGANPGWQGNVMAEPAGKGKVQQKNINAILSHLIPGYRNELTPLRRTVRMVKLGGKENRGYGSTAIYKGIEDRSCPRGRVWVTIG